MEISVILAAAILLLLCRVSELGSWKNIKISAIIRPACYNIFDWNRTNRIAIVFGVEFRMEYWIIRLWIYIVTKVAVLRGWIITRCHIQWTGADICILLNILTWWLWRTYVLSEQSVRSDTLTRTRHISVMAEIYHDASCTSYDTHMTHVFFVHRIMRHDNAIAKEFVLETIKLALPCVTWPLCLLINW